MKTDYHLKKQRKQYKIMQLFIMTPEIGSEKCINEVEKLILKEKKQ